MIGATDGGKHIEAMRTEHMKRGHCALCKIYCGVGSERLERHHEKYHPERCIYLCHHCHHRVHFRPYHLADWEKDKLLRTRLGDPEFYAFKKRPGAMALLRKTYIAPGRRPAQRRLRQEMKARAMNAKSSGRPGAG